MSQAQFTVPLITVIPGQLITAALWNNEFLNLQTNLNPSGIGGYSDTDPQMQIQTAPFPASVTSHASSNAGELERIRYQLAQILGTTYWYNAPAASIAAITNDIVPIGGSILFPSATPPNSNWLLKNGQAISRTVYSALFALISTTFGVGDGSTTFNIPNATDRMPIGAGNLYALAATGGEATHVLTTPEIPAHNHPVNVTDPGHAHIQRTQYVAGAVNGNFGWADLTNVTSEPSGQTDSNTTGVTATTSNTGGGTAHNNLPPYLAEYWMIRVL